MDDENTEAEIMDVDGGIPEYAWAFRVTLWHTTSNEELMGVWHRTEKWLRRNMAYSGLVSVCQRVYTTETLEYVGTAAQHPIGELCPECFGMGHSDQLLAGQPEGYDDDDEQESE
jgi:hypothetical protein